MLLSEQTLRSVISKILLEAAIRRRDGETTRISDDKKPSNYESQLLLRQEALGNKPLTNISQIVVGNAKITMLSDESPFLGDSAMFHKLYNFGVSEETLRIRRPGKNEYDEDKVIRVLADYTIKPGSLVIIPELLANGTYGVAKVNNVVFPNRRKGDKATVPLAMLSFDESQRPPGETEIQNDVGIAFLQKINADNAVDAAAAFAAERRKKINSNRLSGGMTTVRYGK